MEYYKGIKWLKIGKKKEENDHINLISNYF